jgi:hypothetical protein
MGAVPMRRPLVDGGHGQSRIDGKPDAGFRDIGDIGIEARRPTPDRLRSAIGRAVKLGRRFRSGDTCDRDGILFGFEHLAARLSILADPPVGPDPPVSVGSGA